MGRINELCKKKNRFGAKEEIRINRKTNKKYIYVAAVK